MRSIRSIIFIRLFTSTIIMFAVVTGVAYFLTREAIKQFVVTDAATSLSFIINNVKSNYQSDLMALDQIANMEGFLPFDETAARTVVKDFLEFPSIFSTIHMYRADGPLLFAERRATMGAYGLKPNFYMKEPVFIELAKQVIASKHSMASEVIFSAKGSLYQTYITPVFADEEKKQVFGILSGGVFPRLQKIDYLLRGLKLGQDNFILISDSSGRVITSDGISEADATKFLNNHSQHAVNKFYGNTQPPTNATVIDDGVKVGHYSFIVMSLPIKDLKLIVTLGVNGNRIDEKTKELSYRLLVVLVIGVLMSVAGSMFVGNRLALRFSRIAEAINQINNGNFAARAQYTREDEIGYLAKTVNTLAEKIQKSEYLGNLWSNEEEQETYKDEEERADSQSTAKSAAKSSTAQAQTTPVKEEHGDSDRQINS